MKEAAEELIIHSLARSITTTPATAKSRHLLRDLLRRRSPRRSSSRRCLGVESFAFQ